MKLYSSESIKDPSLTDRFFKNLEIPSISEDDKAFLENP